MMAMIGAGLVFYLAIYGPDRVGRFLPRIHVDHPAKDVGRKRSTGGFAFFFGGYGAGQTELGCPGEHLRLAAFGRPSHVYMMVPLRQAEGAAVIELFMGKT